MLRTSALAISFAALCACAPFEPPVVEAAALGDTADTQGPYVVEAHVRSRRSIDRVELVWRNAAAGTSAAPGGPVIRVVMGEEGDGLYRATIPGSGRGALIAYHVEATDSSGDTGSWPASAVRCPSSTQEACFSILPAP
jgi:hypothetical protein